MKPDSTTSSDIEDGLPLATVEAPPTEETSLFGCMRGLIFLDPSVDLTEPILDEPCDAELGILLRGENGEDIGGSWPTKSKDEESP